MQFIICCPNADPRAFTLIYTQTHTQHAIIQYKNIIIVITNFDTKKKKKQQQQPQLLLLQHQRIIHFVCVWACAFFHLYIYLQNCHELPNIRLNITIILLSSLLLGIVLHFLVLHYFGVFFLLPLFFIWCVSVFLSVFRMKSAIIDLVSVFC